MRPAVLEHLVHEGRSAPSNTRADQRRVPSYSAPLRGADCRGRCVAVEDRRGVVSAWVKGKRNGPIIKCWVLICLVLGKSLLAASMPRAAANELCSLPLRRHGGTHPQDRLVSLLQ